MLFMRPATFRARLGQLRRGGYPVLTLVDGLERLRHGTLPRCAVVITIDDGWFGTYRDMAPALQDHGLRATLYLATYHVEKQTQVFNVAAAYALWKSRSKTLDLATVHPSMDGRYDLSTQARRSAAVERIGTLAESLDSADDRQALLERLYGTLGLDLTPLRRRRLFSFMSPAEASELPSRGIDLQLHTHRHRFPSGSHEALTEEVQANRGV